MVDTRKSGTWKRLLRRVRYYNIEALGQGVRGETVLTLFNRREYLARDGFLEPLSRIGVDSLLDDETNVFRTAWRRAPARRLNGGHIEAYQHQGSLYKTSDNEV